MNTYEEDLHERLRDLTYARQYLKHTQEAGVWELALNDVIKAHQPKEFCICAAIELPNGEVIRGHRHNHCFDVIRARKDLCRKTACLAEQGFVTSTGRFVGREEAMRIQQASGKPSEFRADGIYDGDILFSEDLY